MTYPPFILKKQCLYWLEHMIDHYLDAEMLRLLWWQASISPGGVNEVAGVLHDTGIDDDGMPLRRPRETQCSSNRQPEALVVGCPGSTTG